MESGSSTSVPVRALGPAALVLYDSQDPAFGEPLEIGVLTGSMTLPGSKLVVGDETNLYLVDYGSSEIGVGARRDSARYVRVEDGAGSRFAAVAGDETYYGRGLTIQGFSNRVLFGDRTYQASYGNGLLVAETARSATIVFDETGDVVHQRSTLPEKVPVSPDQIEAARADMLASHGWFFRLADRAIATRFPEADGPTAQDISEAYARQPRSERLRPLSILCSWTPTNACGCDSFGCRGRKQSGGRSATSNATASCSSSSTRQPTACGTPAGTWC